MTSRLEFPQIPKSPMYIDDIMVLEWQEFFRQLFIRVGGYSAITISDIEDILSSLGDLDSDLLVATDSNGDVVSVSNLAEWIFGEDGEIVVSDRGDGTVTISLYSKFSIPFFFGRR